MATEGTAGMNGSSKNDDKSMAGKNPSVDDLQAQIELLREEIGRLTTLATDVTKAEARNMAAKLQTKGEEYRAAGEEQVAYARERAEAYGHDAARYVKEQPANALGIAAGIGFVVGFLLTNRR